MAKATSGVDEVRYTPAGGRWGRLALLARCLLAFFARGRARRVPREVHTVVAVLTGKLGDVVCGTPVLRALRAQYPRARIIAAGGAALTPLLADSGLADEYSNIDAASMGELEALKADAAVITGPAFVPAAKLYLAGVPLISVPDISGGYTPFNTWPYRILKHLLAAYPYRMGEYAPRERLRSLEPLGIVSDDTKKQLGFSPVAEKKVKDFFARERVDPEKEFIVGVSATAGNKIKEWPPERFAELMEHLAGKEGVRVALFEGPGDSATAEAVLADTKDPQRIMRAKGLSLDELKALISKLHLFISADTGPIYIAEAFDIPTIDIVGPIDEREQPPRGRFHVSVVPRRERPELYVLNARVYDREEALRQRDSVTVADVILAAEQLLRELNHGA